MAVKTMEMRTSPRTTGRTPLWPARSRASQARNHSPKDWATISGGTTMAASAEAVGSIRDSGASACAMLPLVIPGLHRTTVGAGRHILDHALAIKGRGAVFRHLPAQMKDRDPIRNLEDIVEVVRDHHDGQAAIAQPPHEVEHHLRLHYAQRSGWLVQHDQLG